MKTLRDLFSSLLAPFRRLTSCFSKKETVPTVYTANICKHETVLEGPLPVFENPSYGRMRMSLTANGRPDYCLECIGNMSIRCAWCKEPIVIGDAVIVSISHDQEMILPEKAHSFKTGDDKLAVIGCLRWGCPDCGGFRNGFWKPPGVVHHVKSPIEIAMESESMVIVSDLADPNDTGKVYMDGPAG